MKRYRLEFDSRSDFLLAVHGEDFWLVLWNLDEWLRARVKYGHDYKTATEALEGARGRLRELLEDFNVSLEMGE